jgi:hypothetical protein
MKWKSSVSQVTISTSGVPNIGSGMKTLKWSDGSALKPGDLVAGKTYWVNIETGEIGMAHKDVGPKEKRNRELKARRVENAKKLIDRTSAANKAKAATELVKSKAKVIGTKVISLKTAKRGRSSR